MSNPFIKSVLAIVVVVAGAAAAHSSLAEARQPAGRAAKTWEVKMTNEGGNVRFDPAELTIQDGDTVKWTIAGGSHLIEFWPDSVPAGAVPLLEKAMTDTAAHLRSQRFANVGDSYTIVFAGMPKGTYKYFCRPHIQRGMAAKLTIE